MLGRLGKLKLGFYPTPFHRLDRISEEYGVELYVKREDFSGMTLFGGNKIRKLEYLLHDAIRQGCDTVVTYGATQSNHAMETATAARKCGLNPVLFLAAIVEPNAADIRANLLLDTILGAEINIIPANGQSTKQTMEESQDLIQGRIKELEAQGENAKTIWSETHLTRDGGGAWVREINDRGAKLYPNGNARGEKGGRLADYLEHPELYEAEPGIADINVELGTLSESEKGKYSPQERTLRFAKDTFKNKSMSDIMHEVQHAIQNEEELAAGGSRKLAYAALVSDAYEAVKDTPEFQSLQTKEERLHYLEEAAAKQAGAPDIETAATNGYVNLGGEKMARQTAKRWYYTKDQREKTWPDVAGNVLDKSVESRRIVETLERIGYTKNEIRGLLGG